MAFKKELKNSKCFTWDLDSIMKAAEEDVRRRTEVESRDWQTEEHLMREKSDFGMHGMEREMNTGFDIGETNEPTEVDIEAEDYDDPAFLTSKQFGIAIPLDLLHEQCVCCGEATGFFGISDGISHRLTLEDVICLLRNRGYASKGCDSGSLIGEFGNMYIMFNCCVRFPFLPEGFIVDNFRIDGTPYLILVPDDYIPDISPQDRQAFFMKKTAALLDWVLKLPQRTDCRIIK